MNFLRKIWTRLRSSLWFLPTLVVVGSFAAALLLIETEGWLGAEVASQWPRVLGASADGSREMLSAIATSMITVAGVVFSVTIVALSLTSTQYSPRVLRTFMRDRPTQLVLGVFVGIFAYCLVVLRTIRAGENEFIPSIAVLAGMGYAIGGIAFLIFFIHHVAQSIQASSIVSRIHDDTAEAINHLYPEELGDPAPNDLPSFDPLPSQWTPLYSRVNGYVTAVDGDSVVEFAVHTGRIVRLAHAIGDFVVEGTVLVQLSGDQAVPEADASRLHACVTVERQRTVEQDAAFGLQQLVDVAVKALSPGINDPTTACMCIDQLAALLTRIACRRIPASRRIAHGRLRVIAPAPGFSELLALVFEPVVRHARRDLQVLVRVLEAIDTIQGVTRNPARRSALAAVARDVGRQLDQVRPAIRGGTARRRARALETSLRRGS